MNDELFLNPTWSHRLRVGAKGARFNAYKTLRIALTHRYLPPAMAALAIVLGVPTLWYGWGTGDDVLHRTILLSSSLPEAIARLFVFLDPKTNQALMNLGVLPWWTLETVQVSFWRPLAALALWLDYQLWPDSALLMHAHNILVSAPNRWGIGLT
jgi:hypothetical protein